MARERRSCDAGCGRVAWAKGLCGAHYAQLRKDKPMAKVADYRPRGQATRVLGLHVFNATAHALARTAVFYGVTIHKLIGSILDDWASPPDKNGDE